MNTEQLERVFERFEQADQSTTRKFGGTGLGMPITKSLVELMEGDIQVSSAPGRGTKFTITLPLEKVTTTDKPENTEEPQHISFAQKRILVAEDNEINRIVIQEMLEPTGAQLTFAENGTIAVEKFQNNDFHLVLMDIQMPVMDGVEACQLIKAQSKTLPVIALTANVMTEERQLYETVGFDSFLAKPIEQKVLLRKLAGYLSK